MNIKDGIFHNETKPILHLQQNPRKADKTKTYFVLCGALVNPGY